LDKELEKFDESVRDAYRKAYYTPGDKRTPEQKQIFKDYPFLRIHGGNLYQYNQERANELKTYDEKMSAIRSRKPFQDFIRVLTEVPGEVPVTYRFHRGDLKQPRDAIAPGGLTIAAPDGERLAIPENDPTLESTGRRLAYARWLMSGKHPLVARVLVNRVWMHFFGRGLVNTPSDFGVLGGRPSHPELLDWLASELVESGWRLKHLHRLILRSTVYRQTSHADAEKHAIDPNNTFYWRSTVRRVEAEIIRDRTLATSGALNPTMYGPAVRVEEDSVGQIVVARPKSPAALSLAAKREDFRRSIYVQVRRSKPVGMLRQFDMPEMKVNCEKRTSSTVSTQSLMLMNGEFVIEQSELFAKRLVREVPGDRRAQVALAWLLAYSRRPTSSELDRSLRFLEGQVEHLRSVEAAKSSPNVEVAAKSTDDGEKKDDVKDTALESLAPELQALTNLCQAVLGSSEFLYVD
ncbi:MAG: DUF1553 domain-containing protein, partial [Planctomycetes bacterium]|nr:DUF1553 domain-containing protein [Planctomycetota bacterium]